MRSRRIIDGNRILFDATKEVLKKPHYKSNMQLIKMRGQQRSYETQAGTKFYWNHPYQWVAQEEVAELLRQTEPEFVIVQFEEVQDFYADE